MQEILSSTKLPTGDYKGAQGSVFDDITSVFKVQALTPIQLISWVAQDVERLIREEKKVKNDIEAIILHLKV